MPSKLPQELWTEVTTYLSPILTHDASKAIGFSLTERQIEAYKYENVWHSIFAKDVWLRRIPSTHYTPTLFGYDLHKLYYYETSKEKIKKGIICHLVITIAPNIRLLQPDEYQLFFECLQPHTRKGDDIIIWKGGDSPVIILNVNDLGKGDGSRKEEEEIVVPFLPMLFNRSITRLQSAYMLWQDAERTLKTIESDKIIGVGTERTHESVANACWLWLQDIWADEEKWVVQFKVPGKFVACAEYRADLSISRLVLHEKRILKDRWT